MLFYANGGPGPATKLLRVHDEGRDWRFAPAERWTPRSGWKPCPTAQLDIAFLGEFFMVDKSEVPEIQRQMRERVP
jgi:hypothetical protein